MPVSLDVQGMAGMQAILKAIDKVGQSRINGVDLHGTRRKPTPENPDPEITNNAELLDDLAERGWDFVSPHGIDKEAAEEFVKVAEVELQKLANKFRARAATRAKDPRLAAETAEQAAKAVATEIASQGYLAAGEVWRQEIIDRIEGNRLADGSKAPSVSEAYAAWRQSKYGVPKDDVGRATGDLLASIADKKALRLKK